MISHLKKIALLLMIILLLPMPLWADVPSGHHELPFTSEQGIWDLSGTYSASDGTTTIDFTLAQDKQGKITGQGKGSGSEAGIDITLKLSILGSVKTVEQVTRVNLNMKLTGTARRGARTIPVTGTLLFKPDLDETTKTLIGTGTLRVCANGRCATDKAPVAVDLPESSDGSWTLVLDLKSVDGKEVTARGEALLDNGRRLGLTMSGQYQPTTGVTTLKTPTGSVGQMMLQVTEEAGQLLIQQFSAKLFGQKVTQ